MEDPIGAFDAQLNPVFSFEEFCLTNENQFVYEAASKLINAPVNKQSNPFLIIGAEGTGKTHLMQAIGIQMKECHPTLKVLYTTVPQFFELAGRAAAGRNRSKFINWFTNLDVLLLDDLGIAIGKPTLYTKYFLPIIKHFLLNEKQLILSINASPLEMKLLPDSLKECFLGAQILELPKPELAYKKDVLLFMAERNGLHLSNEIASIICDKTSNSFRDVLGIIMCILARLYNHKAEISSDLIDEVIQRNSKI